VWRSAPAGAFVAQSLVDGDGSDDGSGGDVRETEVILSDRRRDGALDFVTYDAAGDRARVSRFLDEQGQTETRDAPLSCLQCHRTDRGFVEVTPRP
jgi:hypothetical protein